MAGFFKNFNSIGVEHQMFENAVVEEVKAPAYNNAGEEG